MSTPRLFQPCLMQNATSRGKKKLERKPSQQQEKNWNPFQLRSKAKQIRDERARIPYSTKLVDVRRAQHKLHERKYIVRMYDTYRRPNGYNPTQNDPTGPKMRDNHNARVESGCLDHCCLLDNALIPFQAVVPNSCTHCLKSTKSLMLLRVICSNADMR